MNLKRLTDSKRLNEIKKLVNDESKITGAIITHLEEVERRKLYSDLKYSSLFDYCVKELRYSEDQAYRRINAMRVSKKVPIIKEKIDSGKYKRRR